MTGPARFLLVAAMTDETAPFLDRADRVGAQLPGPTRGATLTPLTFGESAGYILTTGIGPVNAAAALSGWFTEYGSEIPVLSVGSAGGLAHSVGVGDVVIGDQYCYADVDARAFGYALGQVPQMPETYPGAVPTTLERNDDEHVGLLVTGASFVASEGATAIRTAMPDALAVDMESAALAQTCHLYRNECFVSVRGVSDLCSPRAGEEFHDGLGLAAVRSAESAISLLREHVLM